MFTNTQNGSERLTVWREFRQNTHIQNPQQVVTVFENMEFESRYLDFYTPDSWPSVFEIVEEGLFCQSGITLVITATLHYFNFIKTDKVRLDAISSHINGEQGLVLVYNNNVCNFVPGQIVTEEYLKENSTRYDSHIIATDKLYG